MDASGVAPVRLPHFRLRSGLAVAADGVAPPLSRFDPGSCGTIHGTVCWSGERPQVPPFLTPANPLNNPNGENKSARPNPNLPVIADNGGVKEAVVFIRAVDASKSRPWNLAPVRVEFHDHELFVMQGDYTGQRTFVPQGDTFEVVTREPIFETLQARGAAFFSLTLPEPNAPRVRGSNGLAWLN